eukprot:1013361-Rhodomonas_salina.2
MRVPLLFFVNPFTPFCFLVARSPWATRTRCQSLPTRAGTGADPLRELPHRELKLHPVQLRVVPCITAVLSVSTGHAVLYPASVPDMVHAFPSDGTGRGVGCA